MKEIRNHAKEVLYHSGQTFCPYLDQEYCNINQNPDCGYYGVIDIDFDSGKIFHKCNLIFVPKYNLQTIGVIQRERLRGYKKKRKE